MALDRAELANKFLFEREEESQQLRKEVRELRQAVQQTRMVYQSRAMDEVINILRKVADSDVTVLLTGESGTGKELLSKVIHEYSSRKAKPMVTVDCGAIAQGLIEVELFGRVKGAYTSAETTTDGYIQQADGSTLFLDEIGELPSGCSNKTITIRPGEGIHPSRFISIYNSRSCALSRQPIKILAMKSRQEDSGEDLYLSLADTQCSGPATTGKTGRISYLWRIIFWIDSRCSTVKGWYCWTRPQKAHSWLTPGRETSGSCSIQSCAQF